MSSAYHKAFWGSLPLQVSLGIYLPLFDCLWPPPDLSAVQLMKFSAPDRNVFSFLPVLSRPPPVCPAVHAWKFQLPPSNKISLLEMEAPPPSTLAWQSVISMLPPLFSTLPLLILKPPPCFASHLLNTILPPLSWTIPFCAIATPPPVPDVDTQAENDMKPAPWSSLDFRFIKRHPPSNFVLQLLKERFPSICSKPLVSKAPALFSLRQCSWVHNKRSEG